MTYNPPEPPPFPMPSTPSGSYGSYGSPSGQLPLPGQPQYGQSQPGQPQYGQSTYGQPQYGQPQYGQPQYGQPQFGPPFGQQPRSRRAGYVLSYLAGAGTVLLIVGLIALVGALTGSKKPAASGALKPSSSRSASGSSGSGSGSGSGTSAPPASSGSAVAPTIGATEPIGTTYKVTSDSGSPYTVRLEKVLTNPTPANSFYAPSKGHHLVAAQFAITGLSGHTSDDANNDAVLQGSNGQLYNYAFNEISAGTNFSSGEFSVTKGNSEVGWVTFELPVGVNASRVQWNPAPFTNAAPAIWQI